MTNTNNTNLKKLELRDDYFLHSPEAALASQEFRTALVNVAKSFVRAMGRCARALGRKVIKLPGRLYKAIIRMNDEAIEVHKRIQEFKPNSNIHYSAFCMGIR